MSKKIKRIIRVAVWSFLITGGLFLVSLVQDQITSVSAQVLLVLKVAPLNIDFGLTFPQEIKQKILTIALSSSAVADAKRIAPISQVERVDYIIMPLSQDGAFPFDNFCKYLSFKTQEVGDEQLLVPYEPGEFARGALTFFRDNSDDWLIEFLAPCFDGNCDQTYLAMKNLGRLPDPIDINLKGVNLTCEINVQVTKIITRRVTKPREPFVARPPRSPFLIQFPFRLFNP